ncbi:hypothetical protein NEPAR04_0792 [Nematocida parisii]|nr:hypothetical protein NEPAR03_2269 [Nematocida parisii]KAI5131010.1 hypothetical protein NEPAR08_2304 [Nematocida parisii]KAI5141222.1 hypothetical protein NEPAR04_0792 [Nematocida parisii]
MRIRKEIIMLFILFTALYASAALSSADEIGPDGKNPEQENPQEEKPGIFKRIGNFIKRTYLRIKNSFKKKKSDNKDVASKQPETGSVNEESFVMVGSVQPINNSTEKSSMKENAPTEKDQPPANTPSKTNEDKDKEKNPAEEAKTPGDETKNPAEEAKTPGEETKKPGEEMGSNPKQPVAGEKPQA